MLKRFPEPVEGGRTRARPATARRSVGHRGRGRFALACLASLARFTYPHPAAAQTAEDDAPVEVTVHGKKPDTAPIGGDELRARDTRSVPGTFGDAFQALAALPGIAPMASGLPFFYVRGAPPADTGYFIDGIPVPTLFHIGPGSSIVPQALVDRVDFYPGAAPGRYGRYVGGIIAGETTNPAFGPTATSRAEANVRLFDASAFIEAPLGESTDVVVAGRYGYPNLLLSVFAPTLSLHFGDYTFRLTRALTDHDRISIFALGAYDHEEDTSQNLVPIDSQFHRIDLRYDHRWSSGSLRVATTFGYDRTAGNVPSTAAETVESTSTRLRLEVRQRFGKAAELSAGADVNATHYGFAYQQLAPTTSPVGDEEVSGAYADLTLHLWPGIDLAPSLRVDEYHPSAGLRGNDSFAFDPKLAARAALGSRVTWVSTLGIAHQEPSYVVPIPGVRVFSDSGLQKVYSLAQGVEVRLPWDLEAKLTGFLNDDRDVTDFVAACGSLLQCSSVASVDGHTYGLELLVQRALTNRLGGWLSYTLSRAERTLNNVEYLSPFDRTHVLSAVLHYDLGRGYGAGLRGTYYTGRPDIPTVARSDQSPSYALGLAPNTQHRLPEYYRIDARIDKRWTFGAGGAGGRAWLAVAAEFFDATLTKEALDFKCNIVTRLCAAQYVGPIALPSIGLEGGW
jgi:hypothetical protein